MSSEYDTERGEKPKLLSASAIIQGSTEPLYYNGGISTEAIIAGATWYAKIQRAAGKWGIEQRGIERVPADERSDKSLARIGTMWLAANMVISAFGVGALSFTVFHLGFVDTVLIILFVNLLAITPVAFFSTFGPKFGLRQMALSRFYFGWYGVKIVAFFNIIACIGWAAVNVILGAQLFTAANAHMPGWSGIIIIAAGTLLVSVFGYEIVHKYANYSWIPSFIVFLITLGELAHSGNFNNIPMGVGISEAGSALSFAASIFGFATGWTSIAADYTVYQPISSSRTSVFIWTYAGLAFPLLFVEMLGAAVVTTMANNNGDNAYLDGYKSSGIGGLLGAVLVKPLGRFGEFCLVILALSIIANNCPNLYSFSLSLQVLAKKTQNVPRFIWTLIGTVIYCAIAIPGINHFESVLENFMLLIAYWLAAYLGISLSDHFFFKRGIKGYRPYYYDDKKKLPHGWAAMFAFCVGAAGGVLGMAQVWFIGPIGKLCGGKKGGDVGFELAFAFSAITYCVARSIELKRIGR